MGRATRVEGEAPATLDDPRWASVERTDVRLRNAVHADGEWAEPPLVNHAALQVAYSSEAVAFRIAWDDPSQETQGGAVDALALLLKPAGMSRAFFGRIWGGVGARRAARRRWSARWPEVDWLATYRDCLRCVGEFARRNGAVLIAKTRAKHADPGYVTRNADRVFGDDAYYPFRTLELMFLSDLYVGMPSASAFEAAFIGKRLINLVPFPPASFEYPLFFPFKQEFYYGTDGLWNAEGFSECVRTFRAEEWAKFAEWGRHGALDPGFSAEARRRVVEKAIGFDDFKASHRFLDQIESVLRE
jgi:hypothetical protein